MTLPPGTCVGDYRIIEAVGVGGMGEVYRAVHLKIDRVVAIKLLSGDRQDASFLERFLNEARVHARLQHPRIATLYDFFDYLGRPCIVMEYVDGHTLDERLVAGPMKFSEILPVFEAVVEAVDYVHRQDVVHRDIKPSNIKISSKGEIKLLDFGIAKNDQTLRLTMVGGLVGTPEYLAPEQVKGKPADKRSDIWALGVLLYEMATRRTPFRTEPLTEFIRKISRAEYVSASSINQSLPGAIDEVVGRCLKIKPDQRYQTAGALLKDLACLRERNNVIARDMASAVSPVVARAGYLLSGRWPMLLAGGGLAFVLAMLIYILVGGDAPEVQGKRHGTSLVPLDGKVSEPIAVRRATVRVDVIGGAADIYQGDVHAGKTPWRTEAQVGSQLKFTLRRDGFRALSKHIDVAEHGNEYSYTLEKDARQ